MFVGTEAEARQRLERYTAASTEPALTTAEVDDLLLDAKRADSAGLAPTEDDWTETWDLNAAAAEGWEIKAGKASDRINFSADERSFSAGDTKRFCLEQAATYRRKVQASIPVRSRYDSVDSRI